MSESVFLFYKLLCMRLFVFELLLCECLRVKNLHVLIGLTKLHRSLTRTANNFFFAHTPSFSCFQILSAFINIPQLLKLL